MYQASTHGSKKQTRVEIDALFELIYFSGILGVNLNMTDRLFSNDKMLLCYRPLDHCMAKQLMVVKKAPNYHVLWLHKRWNGYNRPAEWLLYHQIKVLPLGYGSPVVYVGYS